jgi:hypothetical protein
MTILDVLRYPLSDPPTNEELSAMPQQLLVNIYMVTSNWWLSFSTRPMPYHIQLACYEFHQGRRRESHRNRNYQTLMSTIRGIIEEYEPE